MSYWNIAICAYPGRDDHAAAVRRRLIADWNSRPEANFTIMRMTDLDDETIESLDAAVIVVDPAANHAPFVRPLTMLEELHVPTMALLERLPEREGVFEHANILLDGLGTHAAVLCARLHGMLHRQREVDRLRRELAVAGRSHGGLGEQVARMHGELELAAQVQRELLPVNLPSVHGVNVAALWRPAQYVSGDIYDVIRLDDDHLGLFLADAVGHGVAAALMTMVICRSLTTRVLEGSSWRILDPAEVMTQLNDQMIGRLIHPSRFATAVYAVIDCRSRSLALTGAGHPPPLLVHGDGTTRKLETSGGLLGVFEDETFDQVQVDLAVGDRLMIYSDGFEQAFPGEGAKTRPPRPSSRYLEEFKQLCLAGAPEQVMESVCHRLDSQAGSLHQADDLTLICLEAGPLLQPEEPEQTTDTVTAKAA